MMVLSRGQAEIKHCSFRDLPSFLRPDDVLVLNDTQVIPARLTGKRHPGGGKAEVLLLEERGENVWEALVTPGRRLPVGREITFGKGELMAEVLERTPGGARLLRFAGPGCVRESIQRLGEVPLPPYIRHPAPAADYQTVYARVPGASAAPTAGLHFTPELLEAVRSSVSAVCLVTLHIGMGTFRPIHCQRVEDHEMHPESYVIPEETARLVSEALARKRRVVAVGTSVARALETATDSSDRVHPGAGKTDLFITPGYRFRAVGALLTNFHLPRSTVLVLVCAFAGRELVMRAYREAVALRYRFLSFGDAMLIV
jgi:S-adenosylmethionine:tRNA ribosyltransferase-isomerase